MPASVPAARDPDQSLVARAAAGDARAFERLVERHGTYAYNLALRTLRDPAEAEDVTQEALIRAWRALPRFRQGARFRTWLYRIVVNCCYDRMPGLKRELAALDPDDTPGLASGAPLGDASAERQELRAALQGAIEALPDAQRMLITLRHLQEMSYQEIAEATGMPLGTVKTGIFRARRSLRAVLEEQGHAPSTAAAFRPGAVSP